VTPSARISTLARLVEAYGRTPVRDVAIVGNAPLTPSESRANRIDACDVVVRITSFMLDTFGGPSAHGWRTDVVMLHRGTTASPHTFAQHTGRLYILVEPGRRHWELPTMPHWWPLDLGLVHLPNDIFSESLVDALGYSRHRPEWATTGTLATWTMSLLFPEASLWLAGFSITDRPDQRQFEHAWGGPVDVTPEHHLDAEARFLLRQRDEGRVTFLP